jgi:hypothetical protein
VPIRWSPQLQALLIGLAARDRRGGLARACVRVNPMGAVEGEAGRERGALRSQLEHAFGELDRQVVTDAVGRQSKFAVLKDEHFLTATRAAGWGRTRAGGGMPHLP